MLPSKLPWIRRNRYARILLASPKRTVGQPASLASMTFNTPVSMHTFPIYVGGTMEDPRSRVGHQSLHRVRTLLSSKKPSVQGLPAVADLKDRRRQTESLLRLQISSCVLHVVPHLLGRLDSHMAS
jgi:hypothetical protein